MTVATDPFGPVVGQDAAVRILRAAEGREAHAWLLIGPAGTGTRAAARALAAGVVAGGDRGSERERHVSLALAEKHPDLIVKEPAGRTLRREEAAEVIGAAFRSPTEGDRKVVVATQLHAAEPAALASLLKTVEEPPPSTVFVLLADEVVPELVTIASRCITIEFGPIPTRSWSACSRVRASSMRWPNVRPSPRAAISIAPGCSPPMPIWPPGPSCGPVRRAIGRYGCGGAPLVGEIRIAIDASVEPLARTSTRRSGPRWTSGPSGMASGGAAGGNWTRRRSVR